MCLKSHGIWAEKKKMYKKQKQNNNSKKGEDGTVFSFKI